MPVCSIAQRLRSSEELSRPERLVSNMMSPVLLAMPMFGLLLWIEAVPADTALRLWGWGFLFYSLLPMLILLVFLRSGKISSLHIPRRKERHQPFLWGLLSYAAGYLVMVWEVGWAGLVVAAALALLISASVTAVITIYWKISIHATAATLAALFLCTATWYYDAPYLLLTAGLSFSAVLLVSWARIRLRAHTPAQVAGGILSGLLVAAGVLHLYPWG